MAEAGQMNGAESLVRTLVDAGVDTCFTNPGTSEMHFVAALDAVPEMRGVLCLFEGVVTGAADGYARMKGGPAATLLHLGPGLANGLANLHNARRANTPLVNVIGEHATYHRNLDAPLTSDIEGFAKPVSGWIRTSESSRTVAKDAAAAVQAACEPPGQIASLILPANTAWDPADGPATPLPLPTPLPPSGARVEACARALHGGGRNVLLMNGDALATERGARAAARIAAHTGALVLGDTFAGKQERGAGRPVIGRLPYFAEQAEEVLEGARHLILVGTKAPVSFFAYPGKASELTPTGCTPLTLADGYEDGPAALEALADALGAPADPPVAALERPGLPSGALDPASIAQAVGALLPEHAIVSDEAATSGFGMPPMTAASAPHTWLSLTGGSIGQGLPLATGAAVACPERKVLALEADGSGMYTLQALWTQAREGLDVTTVVFSNRKYAILQIELARVGAVNPGPAAMDLLDLSRPDLDWVALAQGMGVPGEKATTAEEFNKALQRGLAAEGPYLVEAVI